MNFYVPAALALAISISAPAYADTLNLQCFGGGAANKQRSTFGQAYSSNGDSAWGTATSTESVGFNDQVDLNIDGAQGTIRMPRSMLPVLHGGKGGWMDVKNLVVTDREITGSVSVNPLNSPKLRVDRLTGTLTLNGKSGSFTGECQAFNPRTARPKF